MKQQSVTLERVYDAPVEKIWKALTDVKEMKQWYFDLKEFKAEPGFKFSFYGGTEEKQYLHLCEVKEAIANKKLSYSWRYENEPGDTLVSFELFPEGSKTRLKLTHTGFETFTSGNPDLAMGNFHEGWTSILDESLKKYVEPGSA